MQFSPSASLVLERAPADYDGLAEAYDAMRMKLMEARELFVYNFMRLMTTEDFRHSFAFRKLMKVWNLSIAYAMASVSATKKLKEDIVREQSVLDGVVEAAVGLKQPPGEPRMVRTAEDPLPHVEDFPFRPRGEEEDPFVWRLDRLDHFARAVFEKPGGQWSARPPSRHAQPQ